MTSSDAQHFWANHPGQAAWCQRYADTASAPPRDWMMEALATFPSACTVLEVGCHCGPLLHRMQEGGYAVMGIDINATAVTMARRAGLNVIVGTVPDALDRLPAQAFDVVVSSYALAYIAPEHLVSAVQACVRLARLGVIFIEPTVEPDTGSVAYECFDGVYVDWRHSYIDALDDAVTLGLAGQVQAALSCARKPDHDGLNAVTMARLTWPS